MIESPDESVLVEAAAGVVTLTLNRPAARNALDAPMAAALGQVTAQVRDDAAARALVLRGAGGHFMAGGDLKTFKGWIDAEPDRSALRRKFESFVHRAHGAIRNLRRMPKPVVVCVRGSTAGFGLSLMLACDLALAADDAVFVLAYGGIGASPDGGSTFALPRHVGRKRAFELALLNDRFDARAALDAGLVNRVVPAAELDRAGVELAARLARGPAQAHASAKALLDASLERSLDDQLDAEAAAFAACAAHDDFAEGVAAFVEKRAPRFA